MASSVFHTACSLTGLPVCHCAAGGPLGDPATAASYGAAATALWSAMAAARDAAAAPPPPPAAADAAAPAAPPVHVPVPPLYRRTAVVTRTDGGGDPAADADAARAAADAAARDAAAAAHAAAAACARAGREYEPPPGVEVGRVEVESIDADAIDAAAAAAASSLAARRAAEARLARAPRVMLAPSDAPAAAAARARVHVMWPDDGVWWPARIAPGRTPDARVTILYDTGEEEPDADLAALAARGEVAWAGQTRAAALARYYAADDARDDAGGAAARDRPATARAPPRPASASGRGGSPAPALAALPRPSTCRVTLDVLASVGAAAAGTPVRLRLADGAEVDAVVAGPGETDGSLAVRLADGRVAQLAGDRDGVDYTVVVTPAA